MTLTAGTNAPAKPDIYIKDEPPAEVQRDRWRRPLILQPDGTTKGYTRASGLGSVLEYGGGLDKWNLRWAIHTVVRHEDLMLTAQSIESYDQSQSDKEALDELAGRVKDRSGANRAAELGTALHAFGHQVEQGKDIPTTVPEWVRRFLQAYREAMAPFRVLMSETFVVHDGVCAAGTFDRLVELLVPMQPTDKKGNPIGPVLPAGTILILDLKTSKTSEYFGAKFTVQQYVYARGSLYEPASGARTAHGAHPDWALILHLPSEGAQGMLHWVDLRAGADLAEQAVRTKAADSAGKRAITPASAAPLDSLHQAISGAVAPAALGALWQKYAGDPKWTDAHTQHAQARWEILHARAAAEPVAVAS